MSLYRDQLAHNAFNGLLPFFVRWLEFMTGYEMDGRWFPSSGLHKAGCIRLVTSLSDEQIRDLCWRGLIPPEQPGDPNASLALPVTILREIDDQVVVLTDANRRDVFYDLWNKDSLIRLREGELERLETAHHPSTIDGVLAVLWRDIAPPPPFHAIIARYGHPTARPFDTLDEALYFLWLFQRSFRGKAVGVYDLSTNTIWTVRDQDADPSVREVFGLSEEHRFADRRTILTGYFYDESEDGTLHALASLPSYWDLPQSYWQRPRTVDRTLTHNWPKASD